MALKFKARKCGAKGEKFSESDLRPAGKKFRAETAQVFFRFCFSATAIGVAWWSHQSLLPNFKRRAANHNFLRPLSSGNFTDSMNTKWPLWFLNSGKRNTQSWFCFGFVQCRPTRPWWKCDCLNHFVTLLTAATHLRIMSKEFDWPFWMISCWCGSHWPPTTSCCHTANYCILLITPWPRLLICAQNYRVKLDSTPGLGGRATLSLSFIIFWKFQTLLRTVEFIIERQFFEALYLVDGVQPFLGAAPAHPLLPRGRVKASILKWKTSGGLLEVEIFQNLNLKRLNKCGHAHFIHDQEAIIVRKRKRDR